MCSDRQVRRATFLIPLALVAGACAWVAAPALSLDRYVQGAEDFERPLPTLRLLRRPTDIADYRFEDFEISDYDPHPHIKAEVAV